MMKKLLRDALRSYWKEHAAKQIKVQKSKLLIYDEYLKKYVSPEELLIPRIKDKNIGADKCTKSKQLFVFDVLFKKFVNPKLDLLVPGIKSLDLLIRCDSSNVQKDIIAANRNYFWGKKTSKKNAAGPLPPVYSKTCAETEPPQVGWAGQQTKKPKTDPRPELAKPECKFGPDKDPKKKKPPKKKSKKTKYLVCAKVKKPDENMKDGISKTDAEQPIKESSKASKQITYDEENCYSDLKEKEKLLESQDSKKNVSKSHLKSNEKQEETLLNMIKKSDKNKNNKGCSFKIICKKLFSNEVNEKETTIKGSISDEHNKTNIYDIKTNSAPNKSEEMQKTSPKECGNTPVMKAEIDLKSNKSKSVVCEKQCSKSLITTENSKSTNLYLCKEQKENHQIENKLGKTKSVCCKMPCPSSAESANELKRDKLESSNYTKKEKGAENTNNTGCNKIKVDDCSKSKAITVTSMDKMKHECKKAIAKRPKTTPVERPDSSKESKCTTLNNTQNDINKCRTSPHNCMERPKSAHLQTPCAIASSIIASEQFRKGCKSNKQNVMEVNNKSSQSKEEPCTCSSSEKSKLIEKCNKTNDPEKQKSTEINSSRCLKIDAESTEKLEHITQEESFKRADSSTDLSKCSSYLGFKVKKCTSKTKLKTENHLKDHKNDCKKTPCKEAKSKKKDSSETSLKTTKSCEDKTKSKTVCESFRDSKGESFSNEKPAKQTLNSTSQDLKESTTKSTCIDNVSLSNVKKESKKASRSDSKSNLKDKKKKSSQKKSLKKPSKKCKRKNALEMKADKLKSKKGGKRKNITCTSNKEHNDMQPTDESNLCTKYSLSPEYKELKENIKYDTGKNGSCSENPSEQTAHSQDKEVCCKKTEKDIKNTCSETGKISFECQPKSDEKTVQCPEDKLKDSKINKTNAGEHKSASSKHTITGGKQRKKRNLCAKIKPFQNVKPQGDTNKRKIKTTSKISQKVDKPSDKDKRNKSVNACSEMKSSISGNKNSKRSKSKDSICSKTSNGNLLEGSQKPSKSQKGDNLNKLNKLVRRAKCSTANVTKKETNTRILVCSKSTPNIQASKPNNISGISKTNVAITKKPSASKTSDNNSKTGKGSKKEMKNTNTCSFHTLQKRTTEPSIKTSKSTNAKSFSELKRVDTCCEGESSAVRFNSSSYSSQLDLQWNKHKTGWIKGTGVSEGLNLETIEPKTEQNCLKKHNLGINALIDPKKKSFFPSLKNDKYFQLLLTAMTHKSEAEPKDTLRLETKARKDDYVTGRNRPTLMVTKSLSIIKEHSKVCDSKNSTALVSKDDTNNVDKSYKTNKIFKIQTQHMRPNKTKIIITNKITNKDDHGNDKLKKLTLMSKGNMSSILNGPLKETCLGVGFLKEGQSKNHSHQTTLSKTKNRDASKNIKDIATVNQIVCSGSAASKKGSNNALMAPNKNLRPCKTKSCDSFNTLKFHGTVSKYPMKRLQSPKQETIKALETKAIDCKLSKNPKTIYAETVYDSQNMSNKSQFQFDKATNSFLNKTTNIRDKNSFDHELAVPRKLTNLQVNEQKPILRRCTNVDGTLHDKIIKNIRKAVISPNDTKALKELPIAKCLSNILEPNLQRVSVNEKKIELNKYILSVNTPFKGRPTESIIHEGSENKKKPVKNNNITGKGTTSDVAETISYKTIINNVSKSIVKPNNKEKLPESAKKNCFNNTQEPNLQSDSVNQNKESNKNFVLVNPLIKGKTLEKIINKRPETENITRKENNYNRQTKQCVVDETASHPPISVNKTVVTQINIEKLQESAKKKCLNNTQEHNFQSDSVKQNKESRKDNVSVNTSVKGNTLENTINKRPETENNVRKESNHNRQTKKGVVDEAVHDTPISVNKTVVTQINIEKLQELAKKKRLIDTQEHNLQSDSVKQNKESRKDNLSVNTSVKGNTLENTINKRPETENNVRKESNNNRQTKKGVVDEAVHDTPISVNKTVVTQINIEKLQELAKKKRLIDTQELNLQGDSVKQNRESRKDNLSVNTSVKCNTLEKKINKRLETGNNDVKKNNTHTKKSVVNKTVHDTPVSVNKTVVTQINIEKLQELAKKKRLNDTQEVNLQGDSVKSNRESSKDNLSVKTPVKGKNVEKTILKESETKKQVVKENNYINQSKKSVLDETVHDKPINVNKTFVAQNNVEKLKELVLKNCLKNTREPNSQSDSVHQNKESNKNILSVSQPIKIEALTTCNKGKIEKIKNKDPETTKKVVIKNNYIRKTRSVIETVYDRTVTNVKINNTEKHQEKATNKCLNNTLQSSNLQKGETKNNALLKKVITTKPSVGGKYSPKSKNKFHVISKRHRKFTKCNIKKPHVIGTKKESGNFEKSEAKETIKPHLDMAKGNNNEEQDAKHLNKPATLSLKQSRLLMEQPFFKIPKSEHSAHILNALKPDVTSPANIKENAKDTSPVEQPPRHLRLLMQQTFYKEFKPELDMRNSLSNSKSVNSLPKPKLFTENKLHISKSENNLVAPRKGGEINIVSPRKQQSSIRSQLQRKVPMKVLIKQVNVKKTQQD